MHERDRPRVDGGARFAGATTGGRRRPPIFLLVFLATAGAIVVAGFGGRVADHPASTAGAAAGVSTGATADASVRASHSQAAVPPSRLPEAPTVTSEPGPLVLTVRRNEDTVYIHGDVFAHRVTLVYIGLQTMSDRIVGWTSVSMLEPALDGATSDDPQMRFDVEFAAPLDTYPGALLAMAHANDADGRLVGTAEVELAP